MIGGWLWIVMYDVTLLSSMRIVALLRTYQLMLNHHSQVSVQCRYNAGITLYNASVTSVGFLDGW